jgi:hypothetical protein
VWLPVDLRAQTAGGEVGRTPPRTYLTSSECIHIIQFVNASHLTVRNLPEDLAAALDREKRRRGTSLNRTVIDLLGQSLGVTGSRSNGVTRLAGTWTEAEHKEFLSAVAAFEEIDPELWR